MCFTISKKKNPANNVLKNKKLVFKTWVTTGFSLFLQLPGKNGMAVEHVAVKIVHTVCSRPGDFLFSFPPPLIAFLEEHRCSQLFYQSSLKQPLERGKQSIDTVRQGTDC